MFKSGNLLLRAPRRDDMAIQWQFENDPELYFWDGGTPRPTSLEQLYVYFDESVNKPDPNSISFSIEVDGDYIGHCGLHNIQSTARSAELGIEIGNRNYWGKGYGRQVIKMLLTYAFLHRNLNRVWLQTHSENERAIRCYRSCGFIEEGRLRQHLWLDGRYVDGMTMGILRSEFER